MRASFRLLCTLTCAIAIAACDVVYGPTAPSADWSTRDLGHFTLYARPGSFAEANAGALLDVLEDQYLHTSGVLGFQDGPRISVFLYDHGADLNPPLPEARAGVAFPETNAVHAVAFAPVDDDLRGLLAHEANHVIIQGGLGLAGTSFMNEGLASALESERFGAIGKTFLYQWTRANRSQLPRLADLIDDNKWDSNSDRGYKTSASFLAFLLDRYGPSSLRRLYYAPSKDFAPRAAEIYGKSLEALEAEWLGAI